MLDKAKKVTSINNTKELRSFLTDEMLRAANGDVDSSRAKSVTNYAQQIYNTLNIELKTALVREKIGDQVIKSVDFNA